MDLELARYVTRYYSHLMTENERLAYRHLATTFKAAGGRSDAAAQAEVRTRGSARSHWLSDDSDALELARGGLDAFLTQTANRILREHEREIFLNRCPKCGGLARTPKAKLCLHCGHSWHGAAAV